MTDSIASPWNATGGVTPGVIDSSGNVSSDLPCRKCAYNLRGLPSGGRCPECGTAVGFSVQGDLLRFCDPDWVDTLRNGAVCMLSGIGVIVLAVILNAVISAGRIAAGGTGAHLNAATFVSLMGAGLLLIGSWLLTSPDPSGLGEDRYGTSRSLIRITLIISLLSDGITLIRQLSLPPPSIFTALLVIQLLTTISGLVGNLAMLQYLSKLAMRIPDEKLSGRAKIVMGGIGISYGLIIAMAAIGLMGASLVRGAAGGFVATLGCFATFAGLAMLVFGIMYILLLDRVRRALKEQAQIARETWAMATVRAISSAPQ